MRILAIDPGYERLGVAVLEKTADTKETVVYSDCFKTSAKQEFAERLELLVTEVLRVINEYQPEVLAIENLFMSTNQKTVMRVSEVRGALLALAIQNSLTIYEYTPLQIKAAVTGDGRSDKRRLMAMVPRLISLNKTIKHDDEYDAIAIGLTCLASEQLTLWATLHIFSETIYNSARMYEYQLPFLNKRFTIMSSLYMTAQYTSPLLLATDLDDLGEDGTEESDDEVDLDDDTLDEAFESNDDDELEDDSTLTDDDEGDGDDEEDDDVADLDELEELGLDEEEDDHTPDFDPEL